MVEKNKTSLLYTIIFSTLFLISCFFYSYFETLNTPANGIHVWRQSDGLSMALKYYEDGNNLFQPKMHNQLNDNGFAAGEFPGMYYIVGKFYHVFGVHPWVYRGLWWLISFIGYFFLFKFCSALLKNEVWGILISLFTFTSPILVVYGFSFVADPIALSFTFISWYTLYKYYLTQKKKWLGCSVLLICLAATLKITALLSIIALLIVFIFTSFANNTRKQVRVRNLLSQFFPIIVGAIAIFSWYYYASIYNKTHNTTYFFLKVAPIWKLNSNELSEITDSILSWSRYYFYETGRHVLYVFSLLTLLPICNKSFKRIHYWLYFLCVSGFLSFSMLFYSQFSQHDYYVVNLIFIVPLTVLFFVKKYQFILLKNKFIHIGFQLLFFVLLVASTIHATRRASERFSHQTDWMDSDLYEFSNKLEEYGISKTDLILVPHDPSANITLQAINMNGWTGLNGLNQPEILDAKIKAGAKWMIVSDQQFYNHSIVEKYKQNLVVDFKGIRVYKLANK